MTFEQFHNGLRILVSLDLDQLVGFDVIRSGDWAAWKTYRDNPWNWFIRADDDTARKLWALMTTRMT